MMQEKIVVWGASKHATVVADIIRAQGLYDLIGFLDDLNPERATESFCGAVILGGREQLKLLKTRGVNHLIMAFGNNRGRLALASLTREEGFDLARAIHPHAIIAAEVRIGAGTAVMGGAVLNSGVVVGDNAVINTGALIEHACTIGDGALVNTGSRVGGNVIVGTAATIEIGATIGANLKIGSDSVIGAGSVVLRDVPEGVLAYGSPARVIRKISA